MGLSKNIVSRIVYLFGWKLRPASGDTQETNVYGSSWKYWNDTPALIVVLLGTWKNCTGKPYYDL